MSDAINYTIIIPHKDIPRLLQRCLDSVPVQRDDIQVIIVDDNSNPDIVDFEHFPGLGLPHTEVYFTKEGKGAGYARNVGLQHAKGNRLVFADADDFFMPCFNEALDAYKDDEHDIVYFKVTSVDSETLEPHTRHWGHNYFLDEIHRTKNWDKALGLLAAPWARFVKHDIIKQNNIAFQETQYSNDQFFSAKLAAIDTSNIISGYAIYCVTYRKGSLTTFRTLSAYRIRFQVAYDVYVYFKETPQEKYAIRMLCRFWRGVFLSDYKAGLSLLPKVIQVCGRWKFIKGMASIAWEKMGREIRKRV